MLSPPLQSIASQCEGRPRAQAAAALSHKLRRRSPTAGFGFGGSRRAATHGQIGLMRDSRSEATAPLIIVMNARSGDQAATDARATIERVLVEGGRRFELLLVRKGSEVAPTARSAVEKARGEGGTVVAAGGDGTINAVAAAVLGSGCTFGVVPLGTFNYFSRTHGIPLETEAAAQLLLSGEPQAVQVGLVNDKVFLVNASLGLYPKLLEEREAYKRQYGRRRWVAAWAALATLLRGHRPLRIALQSESGGAVEGIAEVQTPTLFVGNNQLQLTQIGIAEAPQVDRGALVALGLQPVNTLDMLWLIARGAFGQLGSAREVFSFPFRRLTVTTGSQPGRRVKVATDGEVAWLTSPLLFSIAPQPLMLIRPAPGADDAEGTA
jgi:diacylglycerol kinase family enzyme